MAIDHDASTSSATFTTTSPFTFDHTPVSTPSGVVVMVSQLDASERITSITYGGVALSNTVGGSDTVGEVGHVYIFTRGTTIPDGTQTIAITHDGNAVVKHAVCVTMTAVGNITNMDGTSTGEDQANPSLQLFTGIAALGYGVCFSGHNDPASITSGSGMTQLHSIDFGTSSAVYSRTLGSSIDPLVSWVMTEEDCAAAAVAMSQTVADVWKPPRTPRRKIYE